MIDAQTLSVATTGSSVAYSPWMPRGADFAAFTAEVLAISGTGASFKVEVFDRNRDEAGDGTIVSGGINITVTSKDRESATWPVQTDGTTVKGFKELVRYKFTFSTSADAGSVTFRMLPPIWFDNLQGWS